MSNNRGSIIDNEKDLDDYLVNIAKNAKKRGVMICMITATAPMRGVTTTCIPPYGHEHPEIVIKHCGKVGLRMLAMSEDGLSWCEEDE